MSCMARPSINKPRYETRVDSRGIKHTVYIAGDPDWRAKEVEELKQHRLDNYTREEFIKEGFQ